MAFSAPKWVICKAPIMNCLRALTATKTAIKCTISSASGCLSPTKIRCGGLVAVLVAVGFLLPCFSVRLGARPISLVSIAMKRFMRLCAALCETLQKRHLGTQNPPRATSWGFDPPSRHQENPHKSRATKPLPPRGFFAPAYAPDVHPYGDCSSAIGLGTVLFAIGFSCSSCSAARTRGLA